jgi:hypothetical protein
MKHFPSAIIAKTIDPVLPSDGKTALLLLTNLILGLSVVGNAQAATLTHQYDLNNDLADTLGGSSLVSGGGTLSANGYAFTTTAQRDGGLSLSNAINSSQYSIVLDYSLSQAIGYKKLIDFKNRTSDNGLYNLSTNLRFFPVVTGSTVIGNNVPVRTVLTRDASGTVAGYYNGVQQFSFTDTNNFATFSSANNTINFFSDDTVSGGNESPTGSVQRILLYDNALTATEVADLGAYSGTTSVPEPFTIIGTVIGGTAAIGMRKKLKQAGR